MEGSKCFLNCFCDEKEDQGVVFKLRIADETISKGCNETEKLYLVEYGRSESEGG